MNKKIVTNRQAEAVDKLVGSYLSENPQLKKAMAVFNLSKKQYSASLQAKMPNQTITSNKTEYHNGNMAGNQ
jgi:hypothetical protein